VDKNGNEKKSLMRG